MVNWNYIAGILHVEKEEVCKDYNLTNVIVALKDLLFIIYNVLMGKIQGNFETSKSILSNYDGKDITATSHQHSETFQLLRWLGEKINLTWQKQKMKKTHRTIRTWQWSWVFHHKEYNKDTI